jgi:aspartyl-tRNA synthetase
MLRSNTCGELSLNDLNKKVVICGWVHKSRDLGGMTFIDVRDRFGITQVVFNMEFNQELCLKARTLGREYVIKVGGIVTERSNKNNTISTGDIEIIASTLEILNMSKTPPFTIEDNTDGGEDLRMKYRYLDLRRRPMRDNLLLRSKIAKETRSFLDNSSFIEVETPVLIKSTPEGARDFIVPSRMNHGQFYALPQSPQTFKQLLMVAGLDRYYQIVKCFRDEDLRADRQPEFTQIDCELSFVTQNDILEIFEGLIKHLFKTVLNIEIKQFPTMTYAQAMEEYGVDKPDTRFDMRIKDLTDLARKKSFKIFDESESILAICVKGGASFTRKQLDDLTEWVKRPQIGASNLFYVKDSEEGLKSSVDKFYNTDDLLDWAKKCDSEKGDLILILAGDKIKTRKSLGELRLEVANRLKLRENGVYNCLWVVDFPLLEYNENDKRWYAMHHPFTSPNPDDLNYLSTNPGKIRANAYDMVINGVEIGGGSIRIHDRDLQKQMFELLGFTEKEAEEQFGFLMNAFEYGAPPHGGLAFGLDRICSIFGGTESIRDYIAFPKNNSGRDVMIDTPSQINQNQLKELNIKIQ